TPNSVLREYLQRWKKTRLGRTRGLFSTKGANEDQVNRLLKVASETKDTRRRKYYLIRALTLATTDFEKAQAYLALAQLTGRADFWESAAALNGDLRAPLRWNLERVKGNPFFERLYSTKLK